MLPKRPSSTSSWYYCLLSLHSNRLISYYFNINFFFFCPLLPLVLPLSVLLLTIANSNNAHHTNKQLYEKNVRTAILETIRIVRRAAFNWEKMISQKLLSQIQIVNSQTIPMKCIEVCWRKLQTNLVRLSHGTIFHRHCFENMTHCTLIPYFLSA